MIFADMKNDVVFRRIFAKHPDILRALLNDLLFVHSREFTEVPEDLPPGPYREAVELANQATFTAEEVEAYRRVIDEIQQARDYGAGKEAEGEARGKSAAILMVLQARGIVVGDEVRERITACTDDAILDRWIARAVTASSAEEVIA